MHKISSLELMKETVKIFIKDKFMGAKLEQAKNKLGKLYAERAEVSNSASEEFKNIPLGQPNILGRKDIYAKGKQYSEKTQRLTDSIKRQEAYIAKLEKIEQVKTDNELLKDVHVVGNSEYATIGAKTSVNNLEFFKVKLVELEKSNEEAKAHNRNRSKGEMKARTYGAEITQLKKKIQYIETLKLKADKAKDNISEHAQSLIDSGKVNQWQKKPIFYFVKGLRKVALEINEEGEFEISKHYPVTNAEDARYVEELLKGNQPNIIN